eukprot:scaffold198352_cov46-Attheya_sp.AAC.5
MSKIAISENPIVTGEFPNLTHRHASHIPATEYAAKLFLQYGRYFRLRTVLFKQYKTGVTHKTSLLIRGDVSSVVRRAVTSIWLLVPGNGNADNLRLS